MDKKLTLLNLIRHLNLKKLYYIVGIVLRFHRCIILSFYDLPPTGGSKLYYSWFYSLTVYMLLRSHSCLCSLYYMDILYL